MGRRGWGPFLVPLVRTRGMVPLCIQLAGQEQRRRVLGVLRGIPEGPMKSWAWVLGPWDLQELLAEQSSSQGSPPPGHSTP